MPSWPMSAPGSWRERALSELGAQSQFSLVPRRWRELYGEAVQRLGDARTARWFVEDSSGGVWPAVLDEPVTARTGRFFFSLVERRESGEPVQYVLGHWAFRKLDLMVDRRVLIPRPETEVVVEVALQELARLEVESPVVVDLGTGSGAIALSIASERTAVVAWATDISESALAVASANLAGLGVQTVGRVQLVHGNWWEALPEGLKGTVTLAVANPPYIAQGEVAGLPVEVSAWEPVEALVAGPTGLEALEVVVEGARDWLADRSALVAEIAPHQAEEAEAIARRAGLSEVHVRPDLAGLPRALVARRR
jgi:release factor glutamine methyltransferase